MTTNGCLTRYGRHQGPFEATLHEAHLRCRKCKEYVRVDAPPAPPAAPTTYPEPTAVARAGDPATSWDAAASIERIRARQRQVYDLLLSPKCDEELIAAARHAKVEQSDSGLRSRRAELVALHLVRDSGKERRTASGRRTIVWERGNPCEGKACVHVVEQLERASA